MFFKTRQEKLKQLNTNCTAFIERIDTALQDKDTMFMKENTYIDVRWPNHWLTKHAAIIADVRRTNMRNLKRAAQYKLLLQKCSSIEYAYNNLKRDVESHNNKVAKIRTIEAYNLIGNVEGRRLDEQQMCCLVKEAYNHLVIAGAGTGKTTTVVGRIKYMLMQGICKPEDILVLSFTTASASEMSERIKRETNAQIEASTFHKLGLNIITKADNIRPVITQLNLSKHVEEQLKENMKSEGYLRLLCNYLLFNKSAARSEFEFNTEEEYQDYLRLNPPMTMKGESVKSYGEMDIANYLSQYGIAYEYEHKYEIDTRTAEYSQYYPDFYLPEYKLYIEYFGIDEHGEVPVYFAAKQGKTATQQYQEGMQWKRELHQSNHTKLLECYAYERSNGTLHDNLRKQLEAEAVVFTEQPAADLWKEIAQGSKDTLLSGIRDLFATIINLIKSNGYSYAEFKEIYSKHPKAKRNAIIITLIEPIYTSYCDYLQVHGEIDFNDMINMATSSITQGRYKSPYKYVIVDEYQDISKARFSLLKAMRSSNYYRLFCVGDDWQSIYRFAGSDIGFLFDFETYWGTSEVSKIETTYRFTRSLIDISGSFIMKNPLQIRKSIQGTNCDPRFALGEINGYSEKYAIQFMVEKLDDLPKNSSVFFIGRYTFDKQLLDDCTAFKCTYQNTREELEVVYAKRPDLKMIFLTAHKSKGLQADYVFIINNMNSKVGFPSKIQDDSILELLLDNHDKYLHAEERRLFYVALTRAKNKVYLVTVQGKESEFVLELRYSYAEELKKERYTCPLCGGTLTIKHSQYGEFLGCSNYKASDCRYTKQINRKVQ